MADFQIHKKDEAPEAARETLSKVEEKFGFVPNVVGVMAGAPPLAQGYVTLAGLFEQTSLSAVERQVVILAISTENGCDYCVAAHSTSAEKAKVPAEVIEAVRAGKPIGDEKLEALRRFVQKTVASKGWPEKSELDAFLSAGYTEQNVLEVILGIGMKTLSNYTNHVAETPLDDAFAAKEWKKAS